MIKHNDSVSIIGDLVSIIGDFLIVVGVVLLFSYLIQVPDLLWRWDISPNRRSGFFLCVGVLGGGLLLKGVAALFLERERTRAPNSASQIPASQAAGSSFDYTPPPPRRDKFKIEIVRFLRSERTRNYESQTGAWWSREDLKLIAAKSFATDYSADELFPEIDAAIDELVAAGTLVGTVSGYRARQ